MFKYIKMLPFLYRVWKMYRNMTPEQKLYHQERGIELQKREVERRKALLQNRNR